MTLEKFAKIRFKICYINLERYMEKERTHLTQFKTILIKQVNKNF